MRSLSLDVVSSLRAASRARSDERAAALAQPKQGRDERFDFIRGIAMLFVVVNHIHVPSLYQVLTVEALGVVSGAEIFLLVSGTVLGLIYRPRMERAGWAANMPAVLRRALTLYAVVVLTNLAVYLLQWVMPGFDHSSLTSWTDPGTRNVYSLFGDHAPPVQVLHQVMLLSFGTSHINVLGLYVMLMFIAPLMLWMLHRGHALVLVAASWSLYALHTFHPLRVLPVQSELAFPVLAWQLLFVHGMVIGYHRDVILEAFRTRVGRWLMITAAALVAAFSFYALNNPWYTIPLSLRFRLIPEREFGWVFYYFFDRRTLGIGRVVNVFLLVGMMYAVLTRYWAPCRRVLGWLCIPLGKATLYVFVMHVAFVLIVANIPPLQEGHLVLNTVAHTVVILLLWLMVRTQFLFRVIPR